MRRVVALLIAFNAWSHAALATPPDHGPRLKIVLADAKLTATLDGQQTIVGATMVLAPAGGAPIAQRLTLFSTKDGWASKPIARPTADQFKVELWVDYAHPKTPGAVEGELAIAYYLCKEGICSRAKSTEYLVATGRARVITEEGRSVVEIDGDAK
jgi:hypothetical protein